jgi:Flp pilus assembly protein TadG
MKSYFKHFEKVRNQAGVSAVIVAICLTMLIGFTALAVDVGYMYVTKNELQNVADAAALAGAGYLGSIYAGLSYEEQQTHMFTRANIMAVVQEVAGKNQAAKMNIAILDADVTIGTWDGGTLTPMTDPLVGPDAVKVVARRDTIANGPILTFFARIFNINTVNVSADATAALTGPAIVDEGELNVPFSLSENNFPNDCTDPIIFSPTAESCAGWHNFLDPVNAATLPAKLLGLIQGDVQEYDGLVSGPAWLDQNFDMNQIPDAEVTPEVGIGDEFNHQGGTVASLFLGGRLGNTENDINLPEEILGDAKHPAPFPALFDYFRRRDDDGNDSIWTATVPVYEDDDLCENPNGAIPIVGFAMIEIHMPNPPPDSSVSVNVYCDLIFIDGRGGGGEYGNLKGIIPNLVE